MKEKIQIFLAGDSTVADYESRYPRAGWGQAFKALFQDHDGVIVHNRAKGGRSSKSFIHEGLLEEIESELREGDYLFIQFGHNDQKKEEDSLYTDPGSSYLEYLGRYVDAAKNAGAIPILVTSPYRRIFDDEGRLIDSLGEYPDAMRKFAAREGLRLIDLHHKTKMLFENMGPEGTKRIFLWLNEGESPNYPNGVKDNTHFQWNGAVLLAELVMESCQEVDCQDTRGVWTVCRTIAE